MLEREVRGASQLDLERSVGHVVSVEVVELRTGNVGPREPQAFPVVALLEPEVGHRGLGAGAAGEQWEVDRFSDGVSQGLHGFHGERRVPAAWRRLDDFRRKVFNEGQRTVDPRSPVVHGMNDEPQRIVVDRELDFRHLPASIGEISLDRARDRRLAVRHRRSHAEADRQRRGGNPCAAQKRATDSPRGTSIKMEIVAHRYLL